MNWPLIFTYVSEKLADPGLYLLALVVGTVINLYGQILVPRLRNRSPIAALRSEYNQRRLLLALSVFIAYFFPFSRPYFGSNHALCAAPCRIARRLPRHQTRPRVPRRSGRRRSAHGHPHAGDLWRPHRDCTVDTGRAGLAASARRQRGRHQHCVGYSRLLQIPRCVVSGGSLSR